MKDPLGVSPSKGDQETTRGKEKIILTSVGIYPVNFSQKKKKKKKNVRSLF